MLKAIGLTVLALIVVVALSVGVWHLGWFVKEANTNRSTSLRNDRVGTQTAIQDEVLSSISDYYLIAETNVAGRNAIKNQACTLIDRLNDNYYTPEIRGFDRNEC